MTHALAAAFPPCRAADMIQAADKLTAHAEPASVIGGLLRNGTDLMHARQVVELLRALRDLRGRTATLPPPNL
jgi:hypothetical protein